MLKYLFALLLSFSFFACGSKSTNLSVDLDYMLDADNLSADISDPIDADILAEDESSDQIEIQESVTPSDDDLVSDIDKKEEEADLDEVADLEDAADESVHDDDTGNCIKEFNKQCGVDNKIYWYDSCGNVGEVVKTCDACETCTLDTCTATAVQSYKKCDADNNIHWYDSCGNAGEIAESCGPLMCKTDKCLPSSCFDSIQNTGETDQDCGGPCLKCADGKKCMTSADCTSDMCINSLCKSK